MADISINGSELFFGNVRVRHYQVPESGKPRSLYVVRVHGSRGYAEFVCGLDLTRDGYYWLGSFEIKTGVYVPATYHKEFSSIERILNDINPETRGREWFVMPEDDGVEFGSGCDDGSWPDADED